MLKEFLTSLGNLVGGRLDVADVFAEAAELGLGLLEVAGDLRVLELLAPKLVLR